MDCAARARPLARRLSAALEPAVAQLGSPEALRQAHAHADEVAAASEADAGRLAASAFFAEVLVSSLADGSVVADRARAALAEVASEAAVHQDVLAADVAARTFSDPRFISLAPALAAEAVLTALVVLAPLQQVSLWSPDSRGPRCLAHTGPSLPTRRARTLARSALGGLAAPDGSCGLYQVVVLPGAHAALVARPEAGARVRCLPVLRQAAGSLTAILDLEARDRRRDPEVDVLVRAGERRLTRLAFDLHDGACQQVALLLSDARLLRSQALDVLSPDSSRDLMVGRIDDLQARMVALEYELRELCLSLESPAVLQRAFEQLVQEEVFAFQRRTGTKPRAELSGRFDDLTASQRIALSRILQEALRNVADHAEARNVTVRCVVRRNGTEATISDDGRGFDVRRTLERTTKAGRIGLVGMMERARLLGGTCEVRSRPGGPTTVAVTLPRWKPLAEPSSDDPGIAAPAPRAVA
jgi:signal transduction histidine kinase